MTDTDQYDLEIFDQHPTEDDLEEDILSGLLSRPKTLSPKFFYDTTGSLLFDQITELDEYYPTRTEISIMKNHVSEMAKLIGPEASLIEFGSGSSAKVGRVLSALDSPAAYVPVEISKAHLLAAAKRIADEIEGLEVLPICADFTQPFKLPTPRVTPKRNVVFFPGSTIGNFYPDDAISLLQTMAGIAKEDGGLLIGVDLKKDPATLEAAYNDAKGVTRDFNLNALTHLNTLIESDFDVEQYHHKAIYNEQLGRIEMHLISQSDQKVTVLGNEIGFAKGETILTECSHKYTIEEFSVLASKANFELEQAWVDDNELFSVQYYRCSGSV